YTSGAPLSVTLTNDGGRPLTIGAVSVAGANAADFTVDSDGCSGRTLPGEGLCTVGVTFTPSATGARVASLSIPHDDPAGGSPATVALSGTGVTATGVT